jgi:hypothetical protein
MRNLPRPVLITVAVSVLGGWSLSTPGCAAKPPVPEPPAAAEPVAATSGPEAGAAGGAASARPPTAKSSAAAASVPTPAGSAGAGSAVPLAHGQTAEERRAALDQRLNDSLGSFDAKLRIEQEKIAKERDARQSTVTTVSNSASGNTDTGGGVAEGSARDAGSAGGDDRNRRRGRSGSQGDLKSDRTAGDLKSDRSSGNTSAAGNGAVSKEIPDGNDDDVVARRLRKAAEQETDPELKDKLWQEYVEYKKNTQGK